MMYFWRAYLGGRMDMNDPRAVPLAAADLTGVAPAFIMVAEYDPLRDDGLRYARALESAGVPVELHYAHHLPHGFLRAWNISSDASRLGEAMIEALRRAFGISADRAATGATTRQ
jgi:acetyl esterase